MLKVLGLFLLLPLSFPVFAESSKGPILKVLKPSSLSSLSSEKSSEEEKERIRLARIESQLSKTSMSFLLNTAAFHQDTFNRPFGSFGNLFLLSIPVTQLSSTVWLQAEVGLGLTFSKVTLSQPDTSFTHLEFPFPFTVRLLFPFSHKVFGDVFGGIIYRPVFYDSRESSNGGFQTFEEGTIKPELGVGVGFFLTRSLRLRLRASYFYLAAGLELIL